MKKSPKNQTKKNSPSVVARLMGVDTLPIDSKPVQKTVEIKNKTLPEKSHYNLTRSTSDSSQKLDCFSTDCYSDSYTKYNKPKPREHPQEEELQKFKKEFEAWQAARFKECSMVAAQANLNREKMLIYANSKKMGRISIDGKASLYSNRISRTESKSSQDQEMDLISAPSKIVILRPGPDRLILEDSWNGSPSTSEERGSIENFLEEVKERLKCELLGKSSKRSTTVRGGGIETPFREMPSESKQMDLLRSESTRSYRSEAQINGQDSPEFINRDTRRFLAERFRNVLKGEIHQEVQSQNSLRERTGKLRDVRMKIKTNYRDSFSTELSPRNLVRSLSAPVSGTSFGKLLLEDRHVLTGAHIMRKHEVIKKPKKEKFNIREKVSSFRHNLALRGRLFRRRVKSADESLVMKNEFLKDITSGPTVNMNFYETHENWTEVPPSPASVCSSSVHEEYWKGTDCFSPTSSSSEAPCVFREINSNLNELRRKLNQFEGTAPDEPIKEPEPNEVELYIEDQVESYIKDLLIAAGLYDNSYTRPFSKWDPLGKSISNHIFEEVENSYRQTTKDEGEKFDHKLLLDLLNEILPTILRQPLNMSKYMEKANGYVYKPPQGRKLLFQLWESVRVYVYPPEDSEYYGIDNMLARDLKLYPWSDQLMDDEINAVSREVECQIFQDLIEEVIEDIYS